MKKNSTDRQKKSTRVPKAKKQAQKEEEVSSRLFDPKSAKDLETFEKACRDLWKELYEKDVQSFNYPFFHSCCTVFSKKKYGKGKHYHPKSKTTGFLSWLDENNIGSEKQFAEVLLKLVKKRGDGVFRVPALNLPHNSDYPVSELVMPLKKRVTELETELKDANVRIRQLEEKLRQAEQELREKDSEFEQSLRRWKKEGKIIIPKPPEIFDMTMMPRI